MLFVKGVEQGAGAGSHITIITWVMSKQSLGAKALFVRNILAVWQMVAIQRQSHFAILFFCLGTFFLSRHFAILAPANIRDSRPSKQCWPLQLELSPSSSSSSSSSSSPTSSPCTRVPLQTILFHVSDFLGGAHSRFSRVHKSFFSNSHSNRDFFRSNALPRKCLERAFSFWK